MATHDAPHHSNTCKTGTSLSSNCNNLELNLSNVKSWFKMPRATSHASRTFPIVSKQSDKLSDSEFEFHAKLNESF